MKQRLKLAQIQMHVCGDQKKNLQNAAEKIKEAALLGADLVCLPEMFCCPYENSCFPLYAQEEGGETDLFLSRIAEENGVYLSAGTVPEREVCVENGQRVEKIYNTAYVYDRNGMKIAKHRKVHLFDIDIKGKQTFRESDTLTAGDKITVFDTEFGPIGLCICFDIRFVEIIHLMALQGVRLILIPAAFNTTTGPEHWELSFRAHSVFAQVFMAGTSTALDETASYHAWGHSILTDPWGTVLSQLDEKEGMSLQEIDLSMTETIREQLPILSARRTDLYSLKQVSQEACK